ncbi:MAG: DUF4838 domain-containing protein [Lentisphaerae bacterium]|nr:DUF4838 domain-containing protein [Lentisphaerota bacterium]
MKKIIFLLMTGWTCLHAANICYNENMADQAIKFAAQDMARCLSEVSGEKYGVQPGGKAMRGDIVLNLDPQLKEQEWKLKNKDGILVISGSSSPGIVYGVYSFLEKHASCLWPAPDTEILPKQPGWKLPQVDETGRPAFLRREMYVGPDLMDAVWRLRNKENNRAAFSVNFRVGKPKDCHTFDVYVQAVKDPSLFGVTPRGGKCHTLCMTNPKVRELILAQLIRYIETDRKKAAGNPAYMFPKIYDISQPDGPSGAECWCENCRKLAEEEGSYAGPNLAFVNYLANAVKAKYPDILLQTFAYSYTMKPPKTIKAADNVMIRFCDAKLFKPLVPGTQNGRDLEIWGKHAANKAIWSYWRIYGGNLYPFVRPSKDISAELRFCKKEGVISYFAENEEPLSRSFAMQQHWLALKLLDDPNRDIFKLNEQFFSAYYGKAAAPMLKYLDYLEKRQNEHRTHLDPEFFEKVNAWLDEAETLAKDDPRSLGHIGWERVVVDRTMFQNLNDLMKKGYRPELTEIAARFRKNLMEQLKNWTPIKRNLKDRLTRAEQETELYSRYPVKIPERFDGCEVIDIHWAQMRGTAVKDLDAVCGTARFNPKYKHKYPYNIGYFNGRKRIGGSISFNPEDIPQDEKFHLYRLGKARIIAPIYVRYDSTWHYRQWLSTIGILGEDRDIWVSMKFTGPFYVKGSKNKNMVLFDRIMLVKDLDPLRFYEPVDVSKNLLKNGGFENSSAKSIPHWGKPTPNCGIDTKTKHSGKASLCLKNLPDSRAAVSCGLGKIDDLKHDLLIRGWVKYQDLDFSRGHSAPAIGLRTLTSGGRRSSFIPVTEFYLGSNDWHSFETIIDIENFKRSCSRAKIKPETVRFHISLDHQPGTVWVDDLEIIPLNKKRNAEK